MIRLNRRLKPKRLALVGGRIYRPEGTIRADVLVEGEKIIAVGEMTDYGDASLIDIDDRLIAPGFIDACRPLTEQCLPPLLPGPFIDRHSREEAFMKQPELMQKAELNFSELEKARTGVVGCLLEGVTCAASPITWKGDLPLRLPDCIWIHSLLWDKNPQKAFAKANGKPVIASVADGFSRAAMREFDKLAEWGMLAPNLLACGGAALVSQNVALCRSLGVKLIWKPAVDSYVLGQTVPREVFEAGIEVLLGSGSPRDGGQGLRKTVALAAKHGFLSGESLLHAVTLGAAKALQVNTGEVQSGKYADLCIWNAKSLEETLFTDQKTPEMVLVGGKTTLCRGQWRNVLPDGENLLPLTKRDDLYCLVDNRVCFT